LLISRVVNAHKKSTPASNKPPLGEVANRRAKVGASFNTIAASRLSTPKPQQTSNTIR
jgi:hypothetical protein